jgi:PAS domain S-box-containing protein
MAKERILIVEDQKIVAEDIKEVLTKLRYKVIGIVSSGEEAIKKAEETQPDLILMDIKLKGEMDGIEAAKNIRAHLDISIVYLTAYSDEKTLERAKITEPFGYIIKPFEDRELHSTIEMAIYKHRTEDKLREYSEELEEMVDERTAELKVAIDQLQEEVDERKRAEEALGETKDLLESVLDSTGEIIFSLDNTMTVTSWNKEAERVLGYSKKEMLGKNLEQIGGFSEAAELVQLLRAPVARVQESETVLKTRDGKRRVFKFIVSPLVDQRKDWGGYVVSGRDVTLLKQHYERLVPGNSYIIRDEGIERACSLLQNLKGGGYKAMIITRRSPEVIEGAWNLGASYLRLSAKGDGTEEMITDIKDDVKAHLDKNPKSAILLDRIDYLITVYDIKKVLLLLYSLSDMISAGDSILLVNLPKSLLTERENILFEQELQEFPDIGELAREEISYDAYNILSFIVGREETTLKDIAEKFSITRPTVNKKVEELKRKGLIKTRKKGLYTMLVPTDLGRQMV